jgi:hypothetical protein
LSESVTTTTARVGDAVEVKGLPGKPAKQGQIVEVLGAGEHVHFRVRWEDGRDGLRWPRRDGLKWPRLASVVVGVDVA